MCKLGPQKKQVKQRILFTTQSSFKTNSTTWTKTSACMVVNEHGLTTLKPTTDRLMVWTTWWVKDQTKNEDLEYSRVFTLTLSKTIRRLQVS
jgi:hypothetical protein